jgi:PAS domain S-box-containing protein
MILANDLNPGLFSRGARYAVEALSFIALCYFASGWSGRRATIVHLVVLMNVVAGCFVALRVAEPVYLQMVTHLGLGMPAGLYAAFAFARDPAFRPAPKSSEWALRLSALSLAVFATTQIVLVPAGFFPASLINVENFEAVFGISLFALRTGLAIIFMVTTLALLNQFDTAMRIGAAQEASRARRALVISEARLSDIFERSPDGVIVADEQGRITMFNAGAEATFGYKAREIVGRGVDCLMPERYRPSHHQHIRRFAAGPDTSRSMGNRGDVVGRRKNGEEFPMEASLSKLSSPEGVIITTMVRDVSQQRAAHEELLNAKLKAEEANKAKSRFIANMSHELRTPLNAILGFSELLSSDQFAGKRAEYAKFIHDSGFHLLTLVNDILDLSKIDAGALTLRETTLDFHLLTLACIELLGGGANAGQITLSTEMPTELPPINGDDRALRQILFNLVSNAVKFTPAGGTVVVFARLEPNGEFAFGVRDTGRGIAEDDQARVFDSFGQDRHDAVTTDKGTGLGLPIVKGLTHAHGGRVVLESREGVGTCVIVFLPASRVNSSRALTAA